MNAVPWQLGQGNMAVASNLFLFLLGIWIGVVKEANASEFPLLMPKAKPSNEESYLCTPVRMSDTETFYVTKFSPNASSHTAHHMLVSWSTSDSYLGHLFSSEASFFFMEGIFFKEYHRVDS